jgi:hemolysin activation/secretion protein
MPTALAQQVPDNVKPGQIERQFERRPEARSVGDEIVVDMPSQDPPANAAEMSIVVRELRIEGATAYSKPELLAAFPALEGSTVPLTRIYDVANSITARYRNDGYVLSRAVVIEQKFDRDDAVVQIRVVEGYIAGVEFQGERGRREAMVKKMVARLTGEKPHRQQSLERFLLLLNDMAGSEAGVSGTYVPVRGQPGAFSLVVVRDLDRFDALLGHSNRGSEILGPRQSEVNIGFNSLMGGYDQTLIRYITTGSNEELEYLSLGQTYWLNSKGLQLTWSAGETNSVPELGVDFSAFNLETESTSASMGLAYPLRRSRHSNIDMRAQLTYHEGITEDDLIGTTRDVISAFRAGITFDWVDRARGINLLDIELSKGIDAFGASQADDPGLSREGGLPDFWKARAYVARVQSLGGPVSLLLAGEVQFTDDILLSSEEFAVGGPTFARAYDASEIVGDSGEAVKAELRFQFGSTADKGSRAMLYAFYDRGTVRREVPAVGQPEKETLESTGGGIRFSIRGWINGYVEAAVPIDRIVAIEGNDDTRVFAGFTLEF